MKVTFWGTRGSIATPGASTVRYGGNTTCLDVLLGDGSRLILDAGTGIRKLGGELMESEDNRPIHLFLTHSHWDHIQGFPFFRPAYNQARKVRIYGFHQAYDKLRSIITNQMESKFFPVNFSDLNADIQFIEISEETYEIGATSISAIENNHPGSAHGFRITENDRSFAFLTDNELKPEDDVVTKWPQFVEFLSGVNVLIHDAMYSEEEMKTRRGYGHSTYFQALDLAVDSGAETCILFHHDPGHDDEMMDSIVKTCKERLEGLKKPLRCLAAEEGSTIEI